MDRKLQWTGQDLIPLWNTSFMTNIERYMHIPSLPLSLTDAKHKIGKKHKKNIAWGKKIGGPVANANPLVRPTLKSSRNHAPA